MYIEKIEVKGRTLEEAILRYKEELESKLLAVDKLSLQQIDENKYVAYGQELGVERMDLNPLAEEKRYHNLYNYPLLFITSDRMKPEGIVLGRNEIANRRLNDREIYEIMTGLQAITNDKLVYNKKTGKVEISKKGKGVKIAGTNLLRKIIGHSKTATINMNKDGKYGMLGGASGTDGDDVENEINGVGVNPTINIGFGVHMYTQDFNGGEITEEKANTRDLLEHELIHALAQMNGEAKVDTKKGQIIYYTDSDGVVKRERVPNEEAFTVFRRFKRRSKKSPNFIYPSVNTLREETKRKKILNYHSSNQIK